MPLGIKILDERKDAEGNDTFVLCDWWRCNSGELPNFAFVLRAVLSHSPNSCPPERLFSIFNAAFDLWKNERAVDRRPTTLPRGTRHFACCACATCSPRVRNLQPEGAQPAALGHDRDFRSSMILSRQHLDAFLITLTVCHARPGSYGEVYLRVVRSLLVAPYAHFASAFRARFALPLLQALQVEAKEMTTK